MTTGTVQTTESGELGLHIAARTVIGRCPAPLNAVEVAVVLETCGYTATRARALGSDGLNALAERVFALVPLYASTMSRQTLAPVAIRSRPPGPVDLARGLAYSSPWLVSLATLLISGVSFWSSNFSIPSIANAVTLATALALLVTGPFIQAFGRRASFYIGLGDQGMVVWITRWTLEVGLLATVLSGLALFLVRNDVLGAGTPATAKLGIAAAVTIAALQLGLAAFYVRRAFLSIGVIVGGGAAALIWYASHSGIYTDPTVLIVWQLRLLAIMAAVCWMASAWWLLRVDSSAPAELWRPSGSALLRAVAPYGLFGFAFFAIVVAPQLISGGLLRGGYTFNAPFAMTSGVAIVVLVPLLAQTVAASEHLLARQFPAWLSLFTVAQTDEFRRKVVRYWHEQLLVLGGLAVVAGAGVIVGAPRLGATFPILADLARHPGLLAACTVGYLLLGIGLFCSQLLFSLSAPMRPLAAAWAGLAALTTTSIGTAWAGPTVAAVAGLVAGAGVYAAVAVALAHRAFTRADLTYYRTL
ncbi:MAG TPA: hypothetical protein VMU64_05430 [Acidimicrobiales bacterium]|nr:hypothetical protein [Acidimicrobiales bacterium]